MTSIHNTFLINLFVGFIAIVEAQVRDFEFLLIEGCISSILDALKKVVLWCNIELFFYYDVTDLIFCFIYRTPLHSHILVYIQLMFGYSSIMYPIELHITRGFYIISHLLFVFACKET